MHLLTIATKFNTSYVDVALKSLLDWIHCFNKAKLRGVKFDVGIDEAHCNI